MIHIQSVELLRALIVALFLACAACAGNAGDAPAASLGETSPRSLDDIDDDVRRLLFDAIIDCENEGLRVAAADVRMSGPDPESRRVMGQHMVEGECKEALKVAERLSARPMTGGGLV